MKKDNYFELVYYVTSKIPKGRVSTYGAIADYLSLGSARMVGWALNQCNASGMANIPAHRVVNRKGELSGKAHFKPPSRMQQSLESEGIVIREDKVLNFNQHFWHPEELDNL